MTFQIVFNLYPATPTLFLPSANVVQRSKDGQLSHIVQRATPATVGAYQLTPTEVEFRLFDLIETLQPKALEAKYKQPKAKTWSTLPQLLADNNTRPVVEKYIFSKLDQFLTEVVRHKLPLTLDAERKTLAKDVLLEFPEQELMPYLYFRKNEDSSIEYRLKLGTETNQWAISEHDLNPLTNTDPAWILDGHTLHRVAGINGNMVKPFRQKDAILIPADKARTYFQQFITKSIRRSRVEADGFRVQKAEKLLNTLLEPVENILEQHWYLKPVFEYEGAVFSYGERRDRVTSLDVPSDPEAEVTVHLVCRDQVMEASRIQTLRELMLTESGALWSPGPATTLEQVIRWLGRNQTELAQAGIQVMLPQVDGKTLSLFTGHLELHSQAKGDWFDVNGQLQVGDHTFPFRSLLPFLKKRDPHFPLPDGTWFLIPEEWFTQYTDLALSLQEKGENLRLPKALYTLLEGMSLEGADVELPVIDPDKVFYEQTEHLNASLRPYQLTGVKWLIGHCQHSLGACLADDMGLGKTLQTIATLVWAKQHLNNQSTANQSQSQGQLDLFAAHRETLKPLGALVILPASLVFNWQRELAHFAPGLFVYAHVGAGRQKQLATLNTHDVVLTTYHTARQDLSLLEKVDWQFIILDESQQIKNRDSDISKVVRGLHGKHKISLSGTPIENSLADLWTQMEFINPATLGTYAEFREQFQIPIEKQNDEQAKARLFKRVQPFFMRRTKEEVAPDLPPLSNQIFYCEMDEQQRKRYEEVKSAMRNQILALFDDPKTRLQALQALMRLRQLACHPLLADDQYEGHSGKTTDVMAQWDQVRRAGHKVLFFSAFEQHLQIFRRLLEAEGSPYVWLTGETAVPDRAKAVNRFQTDPDVQAFLMTLGAGGVGLNLTAADYVFILDPWWNPAREDQAIARAHRIGQEHPVTAMRFIARDTVEEKIVVLQEQKRKLGRELFATDVEFPTLDRSDLEMMLG
ncbi:MAG TPA: DEAD/DEAH box helicase [Saprospiraceae bacterium]|nr:DEAD/DEAH box helicase [Saprospiraceae bacterium]